MEPSHAAWKRKAKAYLKGVLRRGNERLLPSRETRQYNLWLKQRLAARFQETAPTVPPGLFSILTAVWDGSPIPYLAEVAHSIAAQNENEACEWVVLDNGCSTEPLLSYLKRLGKCRWIKLVKSSENLGIARGLRRCLEEASGRYVLPVDADDLIFPDALGLLTSALVEHNYPALLYTDEDKILGSRHYQPYFKPDWDPVLLLNSAYVAHLGVIDREKALVLGAYSDLDTEGSPDWDLFVRFLIAGYSAVHIPEVVYSWRVHARSTADDDAAKPYVLSSQRKVLQRFLDAHPLGHLFEIERNPLLTGGAHFHFLRKPTASKPSFVSISTTESLESLGLKLSVVNEDGFVCFLDKGLEITITDWEWEVLGITELHPETVMIGGRVTARSGSVLEAGLAFSPDGLRNVNRGLTADDHGYFGQMWKQRTVYAVSTAFAVMRARFLRELLECLPPQASLLFLGAWAGARAAETGRRVVYTPFLGGVCDEYSEERATALELALFLELREQGLRVAKPLGKGVRI